MNDYADRRIKQLLDADALAAARKTHDRLVLGNMGCLGAAISLAASVGVYGFGATMLPKASALALAALALVAAGLICASIVLVMADDPENFMYPEDKP